MTSFGHPYYGVFQARISFGVSRSSGDLQRGAGRRDQRHTQTITEQIEISISADAATGVR